MDNVKLVDILVRDTFECAAAAFNEKPMGDNWENLERAMKIRQQWLNFGPEAREIFAREAVGKLVVGEWGSKLLAEWARRNAVMQAR